ncbi:hypothetical protein RI054_34g132190 [Pseudoscourfieldia marina]
MAWDGILQGNALAGAGAAGAGAGAAGAGAGAAGAAHDEAGMMNGDDDGDDAGFVFCEEDDNVDTGVQDAAWTVSVLASTMAQLTEENVKKLVSIMTDERFCPSGIGFVDKKGLNSFLDEVGDKADDGGGRKLMHRTVHTGDGLSSLQYSKANLLELIRDLADTYSSRLLFDRSSPEGEYYEYVDGRFYQSLREKIGKKAQIMKEGGFMLEVRPAFLDIDPDFELYIGCGMPDTLHNDSLGEAKHIWNAWTTKLAEISKRSPKNVTAWLVQHMHEVPTFPGINIPRDGWNHERLDAHHVASMLKRIVSSLAALATTTKPPAWMTSTKTKKDKIRHEAKVFLEVCIAYLCMQKSRRLVDKPYGEAELEKVRSTTETYMDKVMVLADYQKSRFNYPKHCCLRHYSTGIEYYGSPQNWDTQTAENLHTVVKRAGRRLKSTKNLVGEMRRQNTAGALVSAMSSTKKKRTTARSRGLWVGSFPLKW